MSFQLAFFKDRQKFAAAHFTIFPDGEVERLHGHNYRVRVQIEGHDLEAGLLLPFHEVKKQIDGLCKLWDEYVLLPTQSPWVLLEPLGSQMQVLLRTPTCQKEYSFPREDVVLLNCDNVSSEQLAQLFYRALRERLAPLQHQISRLLVTISESEGQEVSFSSQAPLWEDLQD